MPKKVFEQLVAGMTADIKTNYRVGARYLTLDQICRKFKVSRQPASNAVKRLASYTMVRSVPGGGITILAKQREFGVAGKKIAFLSRLGFNKATIQAFRAGIDTVAGPAGVTVVTVPFKEREVTSLAFGDYLLGLDADGIIAVDFPRSALPFYHALHNGMDVVADIFLTDLPLLPVVQTDNRRYGAMAAERMSQNRITDIRLVAENTLEEMVYAPDVHERYQGFMDAFKRKKGTVKYIALYRQDGVMELQEFLGAPAPHKGLFAMTLGVLPLVATQLVHHAFPVTRSNFLIYDYYEDVFRFTGLPDITPLAPAIPKLGAALAAKLINKWRTGKFGEPLCERI
jgi:DNA-binding LacI/PurR family transcriptional regulator